ncbi:hypothetical protein [Sporotomaculum syntrophicum]|uniref:hypothetical protein n=1 Tax=Sporotomaculum syntrophicum TaxID=182264 RepID=UPI001379DE00|nr:hypothetical protein [Sporotomaculum syntrophicum]
MFKQTPLSLTTTVGEPYDDSYNGDSSYTNTGAQLPHRRDNVGLRQIMSSNCR